MNIAEFSSKLISVESVKDKPSELLKVLEVADKELKGINSKKYLSNNIPSTLYYNTPKLSKKFKIILNAHLDVVPAKAEQFKPYTKGDKLFGRGAMDMKAASAVMILVFKELAGKVKYPLGLQLVTDEEIGGFNGTKYQVDKGIRADLVITGESTNLDISNESKGIVWLKLKFKGNNAHAAYLWNGTNSNKIMFETLNKIWEEYPIPTKEAWRTTANVAKVLTNNETFNKVPDYSEAWIDIRYVPADSGEVLPTIKKLIPENCEIEIIENEPPHYSPKNSDLIKKLIVSAKKRKITPNIISKNGGNDARHFSRVGCNGIEFGPIGEGLHSDSEWVSIKSLEEYYQILKDFLLSLNT